jgi:polyferredoxin
MDPEILVAIFVPLSIVAVIALFVMTRHRERMERMAILEKGMKAEDIKALYQREAMPATPLSSLKWGIIFLAIGIAALIGMWLNANYYVEEGVIPALMALFGGLGLIAFYFVARRNSPQ